MVGVPYETFSRFARTPATYHTSSSTKSYEPEQQTCSSTANGCKEKATLFCRACELVGYCSRECQINDRPSHKGLCISTRRKPTQREQVFDPRPYPSDHPFWSTKPLWGSSPPRNILNLENNEGLDYQEDLLLCFAQASDLRNVMKTILSIPETYRGRCKLVINHPDLDIFTRNILVLFLAISAPNSSVSDVSCERQMSCALHLWYSAFLTKGQHSCLNSTLKGIIHDCLQVKQKSAETRAHFKYGNSVIVTAFSPEQLHHLRTLLVQSELMTYQSAKEIRDNLMNHPHSRILDEQEAVERSFIGAHTKIFEKYKRCGVLTPIAWSPETHTEPNPTFFREGRWLACPLTMPVDNTSLQHLYKFSRKHFLPTNDLHGALYQDMDQMIHAFEKHVHALNIEFHFTCQPLSNLPLFLVRDYEWFTIKSVYFDRIDVSNVPIDDHDVTIKKYLPLLSRMNKHATMVHKLSMGFWYFQVTQLVFKAMSGTVLEDLLPYNFQHEQRPVYEARVEWSSRIAEQLKKEREFYKETIDHCAARPCLVGSFAKDDSAMTVFKPWQVQDESVYVDGLVDERQLILGYASHNHFGGGFIEWRRPRDDQLDLDASCPHEWFKKDAYSRIMGKWLEARTIMTDPSWATIERQMARGLAAGLLENFSKGMNLSLAQLDEFCTAIDFDNPQPVFNYLQDQLNSEIARNRLFHNKALSKASAIYTNAHLLVLLEKDRVEKEVSEAKATELNAAHSLERMRLAKEEMGAEAAECNAAQLLELERLEEEAKEAKRLKNRQKSQRKKEKKEEKKRADELATCDTVQETITGVTGASVRTPEGSEVAVVSSSPGALTACAPVQTSQSEGEIVDMSYKQTLIAATPIPTSESREEASDSNSEAALRTGALVHISERGNQAVEMGYSHPNAPLQTTRQGGQATTITTEQAVTAAVGEKLHSSRNKRQYKDKKQRTKEREKERKKKEASSLNATETHGAVSTELTTSNPTGPQTGVEVDTAVVDPATVAPAVVVDETREGQKAVDDTIAKESSQKIDDECQYMVVQRELDLDVEVGSDWELDDIFVASDCGREHIDRPLPESYLSEDESGNRYRVIQYGDATISLIEIED